jgi:hypothetical protein
MPGQAYRKGRYPHGKHRPGSCADDDRSRGYTRQNERFGVSVRAVRGCPPLARAPPTPARGPALGPPGLPACPPHNPSPPPPSVGRRQATHDRKARPAHPLMAQNHAAGRKGESKYFFFLLKKGTARNAISKPATNQSARAHQSSDPRGRVPGRPACLRPALDQAGDVEGRGRGENPPPPKKKSIGGHICDGRACASFRIYGG